MANILSLPGPTYMRTQIRKIILIYFDHLQTKRKTKMALKHHTNMRSRIVPNDKNSPLRLSKFYQDRKLLASCVRCDESSSSSSLYKHGICLPAVLEQCAHCGFDVCQDCRSVSKGTLYSALFYSITNNHCLCNECYHILQCVD
jgi:hypothetical protein